MREKQLKVISNQVEEVNEKLTEAYELREDINAEKDAVMRQLKNSEDRFKEHIEKL